MHWKWHKCLRAAASRVAACCMGTVSCEGAGGPEGAPHRAFLQTQRVVLGCVVGCCPTAGLRCCSSGVLQARAWGSGALGGSGAGVLVTAVSCPSWPQRAIRVRSHSMETMVGSQRKQHGGGIPGSLSGGIAHNSSEVTKTTFSVSAAPWPSAPLSVCVSTPSHAGRVL